MAWLSAYVTIGCLLAAVSLVSSKPDKLSPAAFALAHALWPATLILVLLAALASRRA